MRTNQLLVANALAAIFVCVLVVGETRAAIITTTLVAALLSATGTFHLTSRITSKRARFSLSDTLQRILLLASVSILIFALPVVLIAIGTSAVGSHFFYKIDSIGDYSGAAAVGSIAGALAGTMVGWAPEVVGRTSTIHLVRSLDQRAGAVGAALALAFSLGPTGTYAVNRTGIVIGIFTGMLTAAITSRLAGAFGGSLASALKSTIAATSLRPSAFSSESTWRYYLAFYFCSRKVSPVLWCRVQSQAH